MSLHAAYAKTRTESFKFAKQQERLFGTSTYHKHACVPRRTNFIAEKTLSQKAHAYLYHDLRKVHLVRIICKGPVALVAEAIRVEDTARCIVKIFGITNESSIGVTPFTSKTEAYQEFHAEYTNLRSVRGVPGIVQMIGWGSAGGLPAILTEYSGDTTLREWLSTRDSKRNSADQLYSRLSMMIQICHILADLHRMQIQHNDLKCDNVVVREGAPNSCPTVTLIDLGSATAMNPTLTNRGFSFNAQHLSADRRSMSSPMTSFRRTIEYTAPEAVRARTSFEPQMLPPPASYQESSTGESPSSSFASTAPRLLNRTRDFSSASLSSLIEPEEESEEGRLRSATVEDLSNPSSPKSPYQDISILEAKSHLHTPSSVVGGAADLWSVGLLIIRVFHPDGDHSLFDELTPRGIERTLTTSAVPVEVPDCLGIELVCECIDFLRYRDECRAEQNCSRPSQSLPQTKCRTPRNQFAGLQQIPSTLSYLARWCLQTDPKMRPTAQCVMASLVPLLECLLSNFTQKSVV